MRRRDAQKRRQLWFVVMVHRSGPVVLVDDDNVYQCADPSDYILSRIKIVLIGEL